MLHILSYTPAWRSDPVLCSMFSARKRVFIDLLKWDLPIRDGAYELDQFDAPGATYLILSAADGSHRASTRLLPTSRPHLLDTIFGYLCAGTPPRGKAVREITRFCLERELRAPERRDARDQLVSALVDYGHVHELSTYTGIAQLGWFEQIRDFGWDCRQLPAPSHHGRENLAAFEIILRADTRERLAATGVYRGAVEKRETRHAA